jgi:hypothetical protein
MFGIIIPVQIDGENRYALVGSPDPHVVAGLIAASELPAGWQAAVSDATHRIIVASDQQDAIMGKELPRAQCAHTWCLTPIAISRRFWDDDLPADSQRHVDRPPPLCISYRDCLGHVVGIVAAVLSGLETQAGAIAVGILRAHRLGQFSERLCVHVRIAFIPSLPSALQP